MKLLDPRAPIPKAKTQKAEAAAFPDGSGGEAARSRRNVNVGFDLFRSPCIQDLSRESWLRISV